MRLRNKVSLITGGGAGIGKNIAIALGAEGATVVICDINSDLGNTTLKELRGKGIASDYYQIDLNNLNEIDQLVDWVMERHHQIDILVNNARSGKRVSCNLETEENWDTTFRVNLKTPFFLSRRIINVMNSGGAVINIGSISGQLVSNESPSYQISKSAILQMTRYLAVYGGEKCIRVNSVLPGFIVQDENLERYSEETLEQKRYRRCVEAIHPYRKSPGTSNDVASAVVFLASLETKFITGQMLLIDGGLSILDPTKVLFDYEFRD